MTKEAGQRAGQAIDRIADLYMKGVFGDEASVREAERLLEEVRGERPNDPLAKAYHGSVNILIARDKTLPLEKLRWSKAGMKLLDEAAAAAPDDEMVRLLRGRSAYKLPEKYFGRTRTAIEDFVYLTGIRHRAGISLLPVEFMRIRYELGECYRRIGRYEDAEACWRELAGETDDAELGALLEHKLQLVEGKPNEEIPSEYASPSASLASLAVRTAGSALHSLSEPAKAQEKPKKKKKKKKK